MDLLIFWLCSIGMLICFVLVMIQVFRRGHTVWGIACLVLAFVYGAGTLIAFAYGWINARRWHIQKVMLAWTACITGIIAIIVYTLSMLAKHSGPLMPFMR